ncbi:uncharacterized protein LOC124197077 [Daphnia pulex]|uniref:uncharacterized protein LOC124197077 n=1 Tax=Daphnia pulex TaxID=6669 RepID=UPI001EE0EC4B|nr:uncharacterized protein LOC124197077 [Daphnia pulex]
MKLTLVTYFVGALLAIVLSWAGHCSAASSMGSLQKMVAQRGRLVSDMNFISDGLERSRLAKNQRETELFLDQLDRVVWPKIIHLSSTIYDNLIGDDELDKEFKYQEELRKDVAAIRFRAKARRCKAPDDTFYPPWKRCVTYQGRHRSSASNPCPIHQQLYDGPDNLGICDCQMNNNNGSAFLYSDRTKQCHQLYTQGPCKIGHWWIVNDRIPACQIVPKGCPADGRHVYGSANNKREAAARKRLFKSAATNSSNKCWRLKSRGPCRDGQLLELDSSDNSIHCRSSAVAPSTLASVAVAPRRVRPAPPLSRPMTWCPLGSYRDRRSKCAGYF